MAKPCFNETLSREETHVKGIRNRVRNKWKGLVDKFEDFRFFPKLPAQLRNDITTELIGITSKMNKYRETFEDALWGDLGKAQKQSAANVMFARDQVSRVKAGTGHPDMSVEVAQSILREIEALAKPEELAAADRWRKISSKMREDLIARGKLSKEQTFEDYAPHYVIDYFSDRRFFMPSKLKRQFRGYTKRTRANPKEFRRDFNALIDHMLATQYDNVIEDFMLNQAKKYDVTNKLTRKQLVDLRGTTKTKSGQERLRPLDPNKKYVLDGVTYRAFNPEAPYTRNFFKGEEGGLRVGGTKKMYLLEEPIYKAFNQLSEVPNKVVYAMNSAVSYWKSAAILSNFASFNINNLVGDTIMLYTQHPHPIQLTRHLDDSFTMLQKMVRKKELSPKELELQKFLIDEGIMSTGFATELRNISGGKNPVKKLLQKAQNVSEIREDFLRSANGSWLKEQLEKGNAAEVRKQWDWIDTKDLSDRSALGKIGRESLIDYRSQSSAYRQWIRGGLLPFATWYHKGSQLMWNHATKHPIKTLMVMESAPALSMLYNNRSEEIRELEMELPEWKQNTLHFTIGKNPNGTIRTLDLMTPFEALIGTKIFTIATNQMNLAINGQKTFGQALSDTAREWGGKERRGIENLINPITPYVGRFNRGMMSHRDPFDNQPIYPTDPSRLTANRRKYYEALFFIKTMTPFLSVFVNQTQGKLKPTEQALLDQLSTPVNIKRALGIVDNEPNINADTKFGPIGYKESMEVREEVARESALLNALDDHWIRNADSSQTDALISGAKSYDDLIREWAKTEGAKSRFKDVKDFYGDTYSAEVEDSILKRMSDFKTQKLWMENIIDGTDDPAKQAKLRKAKEEFIKTNILDAMDKSVPVRMKEKVGEMLEKSNEPNLFDELINFVFGTPAEADETDDIVTSQLKIDEGFRSTPYIDTTGNKTIGFGRNIDARPLGVSSITKAEAEKVLKKDVKIARSEVNKNIPSFNKLSPNRQAVLVNMNFNMGIKKLLGFKKMLAAINDGDFNKAADEMLDSKWAKQVGNRAKRLARKMRGGS